MRVCQSHKKRLMPSWASSHYWLCSAGQENVEKMRDASKPVWCSVAQVQHLHRLWWGRTQTPLALHHTSHCYLSTLAGRIMRYCPVCYLSSSRIQWECFQPELQYADRKHVGRVYTSSFVSLFLTSLCICNIRHMHGSAKELWEKQIHKVENTG